ncbi:MAG TPA: MMPL family transporter [Acetobacteraceae bacterium]|nr:MMPL family transporter [Acetobacteraceae bacterium]
MILQRFTMALVEFSRRYAWLTILLVLVLTGLGLGYARSHLGIDTNTDDLFSPSLPWRQQAAKLSHDFPQFDNLLVAVVSGKTPEEADETAAALTRAVSADRAHFIDVERPDSGSFYNQNGFLLLPADQLAGLLNGIVTAQPFLGQLTADPTARGLFAALGLLAQGSAQGQANLTPYQPELAAFQTALDQAAAGNPAPLSWQTLIAPGLTGAQGAYRFVLIHPVLDHGTLEPGGAATAALKQIIAGLPDVAAGRADVHYTGQIPLADEEFASLAQGMVTGLVISLILIALWLFLAVHSWRLILPILATLAIGLALTFGFAAIAIGRLNLISVAFAILFVGLAVDFAIQFAVRLRERRFRTGDAAQAMTMTAQDIGVQIALAAAATASGFLAFAPTSFVGVAELGIIAGAGMIIAFFCTITFLPALLSLTMPRPEQKPIILPFGLAMDRGLAAWRRPILAGFALLAIAGVGAGLTQKFDSNPLHTKDPHTEGMRTLNMLLGNPITNPFYADILVPNLAAARTMTDRLTALPEISQVISGASFIPTGQSAKLAMIAQTAQILAPSLAVNPNPAPLTAADLRAAMAKLQTGIAQAAPHLPADSPLRGIAAALARLQTAPDATVLAMNSALTRFLPGELERLATALTAAPVSLATLPPAIKRNWFLPDGQVLVQAVPTEAESNSSSGLAHFVRAVRNLAPDAGGPAVQIIATAGTILYAFREAALLAAAAITVILLIALRSWRDTSLVLVTLAMSALLTALFARLVGLTLNYANIIALPLLLGVGVSFNVYFVMNWRAGRRQFLGSATARAILFSALTTATAFGSLVASHDRGTASMGLLLLLSLAAVLIATFIMLPALLFTLTPPAHANGD